MAIGAAIGLWRARVVEMTGMPELIALLHSFVGLAAVLVGWNGYLLVEAVTSPAPRPPCCAASSLLGIHSAEVVIGVFIGAVTFTGSIVANLQALRPDQVHAADAARQEHPQRRRAGRRSSRSRSGS